MRIYHRIIYQVLLCCSAVCLLFVNAQAQTDLYISTGTTVQVAPNSIIHTDGGVKGSGDLVLDASADGYSQLSQSGSSTNTASVEVGKYLANTNSGWRSFGFPFTGDMSDLSFNGSISFVNETNDGGVSSRHNFFTWNATDAGSGIATGWQAVSSTGNLPAAAFVYTENNGYHDFSQDVRITGLAANGDQTYSLVYTLDPSYVSGNQDDATGWNYIPNPYPCNISVSTLFLESGFPDYEAVHLYDYLNSQYVAVIPSGVAVDYNTGGGSNTTTTHIAPMEGFWVKTQSGGNTLTISNSVKDPDGSATAFMKNSFELLRLNLRATNATLDQLVVYFDETSTPNYDVGKEALKKYSTEPVPSISLECGLQDMSIVALPSGGYSIPIHVRVPAVNESYTFELIDNELDPWSSVELEDLQSGVRYNLRNTSPQIVLSLSEYNNRFVLHINKSGIGLDEPFGSTKITVWRGISGDVHVGFTDHSVKGWIRVYAMNGQLLTSEFHQGGEVFTLDKALTPGVYAVQFEGGEVVVAQKLIVY